MYNYQLIITVGTSPEPIKKSIEQIKPKKIIFIASKKSEDIFLENLNKEESKMNIEQRYNRQWITLEDFHNIQKITEKIIQEVKIEHNNWIKHGENYLSVLDFTGGTKAMVAALTLCAYNWKQYEFRYTSVKTEQKVSVIPGTEKIIKVDNPLEIYGYQVIEEAILLFNSYSYSEAHEKILNFIENNKNNPDKKKSELFVIKEYFDFFKKWDNFNHKDAQKKIGHLEGKLNDLKAGFRPFINSEFKKNIEGNIKDFSDYFNKMINNKNEVKNSPYLIADLIANAYRKSKQGKYDDAIARLYRSFEAMAQYQLLEKYQIDTSKVDDEQLIPELKKKYEKNKKDIKLGLQESFLLLKDKKDVLGEYFYELKLHTEISPLSLRNKSILAHGFESMKEKNFNQLLDVNLKLFKHLQKEKKIFNMSDNKDLKEEFKKLEEEGKAPFFPKLN
ncbi:MAG: TIGR02710 family CRISPR-associated protein [Bdellovibrionales bacterium]|nr:TIGR02710 family CRISPR-associated protein [Bdellovibrionales bacterium]